MSENQIKLYILLKGIFKYINHQKFLKQIITELPHEIEASWVIPLYTVLSPSVYIYLGSTACIYAGRQM